MDGVLGLEPRVPGSISSTGEIFVFFNTRRFQIRTLNKGSSRVTFSVGYVMWTQLKNLLMTYPRRHISAQLLIT